MEEQKVTHTTPPMQAPTFPPPIQLASTTEKQSKFPDPEPFDGDRMTYATFRFKAKAKLRNDLAKHSEQYQIKYIMGRTKGYAASVVLPWCESYAEISLVDQMWAFLDQQFDDPHLKARALDQLNSLRQGKRSVREYQMEFNRLLL